MAIKVGIVGCMGRVGQLLVNEVLSKEHEGLSLAGGTVLPGEKHNVNFLITDDPAELFSIADVVIDFTAPSATRLHAKLAAEHKTAHIIGTTGLSVDDEEVLTEAAKETTIVYAANMSVGVNILLALVEQAATRLDTKWDIEIFESHHKHKVDAPSGTALAIGKAAASGRGVKLDDVATYSREGQTGLRKEGTIGFSVARGGDVVGEHTTYFYADGERIELSHIATNRTLFAKGAIRAALWASKQPNGLYSMKDVLDL